MSRDDGRAEVVVTGLGAITPLGADVQSTWAGLLAGRSGARALSEAWCAEYGVQISDFAVQFACLMAADPADSLERVQARRLDRSQQAALVAAREAWQNAGTPEVDPERLAVVVGTGVGGALTLLAQDDVLEDRGPRKVSPLTVQMLMPNGPAAAVGLDVGARAGVHTTVSACASGAESVALGLDLIRAGRADVVIVGGTEACVHPLPLAGFAQARALSRRNDDPAAASRPYDRDRDGFVMGEGAGMLVLERAEFARARGATVLAGLAGAGITADGYDMVAPDPEGRQQARAITLALRDGALSPTDVGHVNAHATSTPVGDVAEAAAIHAAIGEHAVVSATKSALGHLLGGAGAIESVFTVLALRDQLAPAVLNLENLDDDKYVQALDIARGEPRSARFEAAINDSFGFGGHNVALLFTRA